MQHCACVKIGAEMGRVRHAQPLPTAPCATATPTTASSHRSKGNPPTTASPRAGSPTRPLEYLNDWVNKDLDVQMSYKAAGLTCVCCACPPKTSLMACAYQKEYSVAGVGVSGTVQFDKGSGTLRLACPDIARTCDLAWTFHDLLQRRRGHQLLE